MNTPSTTSATKLVKRFDSELKKLLVRDLVNIRRAKKQMASTFNAA
jgi:hypothetical protein